MLHSPHPLIISRWSKWNGRPWWWEGSQFIIGGVLGVGSLAILALVLSQL